MITPSEEQKVIINRLFEIIALDDHLAEKLASELEIPIAEFEDIVNNVVI